MHWIFLEQTVCGREKSWGGDRGFSSSNIPQCESKVMVLSASKVIDWWLKKDAEENILDLSRIF